jgi:hypothetical protein
LCSRRFTDEEYQQWSIVVINDYDPELVGKKVSKVKPKRLERTVVQELIDSAEGTVGRPVTRREAM